MPLDRVAEPALLTDTVFAAIRSSIVNGELPAGYRLRIADLANRVGTSHMPVREAIKRLEEAGLAERVPHKGAVVKGLTLQELLHVYEVRRVLEMEAARQGASTITSPEVEEMQREYDLMRAAITQGDPLVVLDHDEALLTVLYRASGNPVYTSTIKGLWEQCRAYKVVGARATLHADDDSALWRFQAQLLEAARSRDADLAAEITDASLRDAASRVRAQLTSAATQASD
jgi:DNA-binding GntR family transcriptional regulator